MSGRRTRQTPAERRRPVAARGRQCKSCGQRHEPQTGRLCPAMEVARRIPTSPIDVPDDLLNTNLVTTGNLLSSSPVESVLPVPPVQPTRALSESLNLSANTCSDFVDKTSALQARLEAIEGEKDECANQSWATLSRLSQGRANDNVFQEAPPGRGLPNTLPSVPQLRQPV